MVQKNLAVSSDCHNIINVFLGIFAQVILHVKMCVFDSDLYKKLKRFVLLESGMSVFVKNQIASVVH